LWLFDWVSMTHIYAKDPELEAWNKIQRAMSRTREVREGFVPFMTFTKARLERSFP
jgi:hypothetical protein